MREYGLVSLRLEGDHKTKTQEYERFFSQISVEIIGFVITKTLSLHVALYPLQTVQSG